MQEEPNQTETGGEEIQIVVDLNYNRNFYSIDVRLSDSLLTLRNKVYEATNVPPALQKLMYKGVLKDDSKSLDELKLKNHAKLMLFGTSVDKVMELSRTEERSQFLPILDEQQNLKQEIENFCEEQPHKRIIDAGPPEDAEEGIPNQHYSIPSNGINGIISSGGARIRLIFKNMELGICSSISTQTVPFGAITDIQEHFIKGHPNFRILALLPQKFFIYWVPSHYVNAIKNTILGFQF